jgi:hypothetical protein
MPAPRRAWQPNGTLMQLRPLSATPNEPERLRTSTKPPARQQTVASHLDGVPGERASVKTG